MKAIFFGKFCSLILLTLILGITSCVQKTEQQDEALPQTEQQDEAFQKEAEQGDIDTLEKLSAQKDNTIQFSFIFPFAETDGTDGIYIQGEYNPSLPVLLLDKNESKYCEGITGDIKLYDDTIIRLTLTSVLDLKGCKAIDEYSIALVGNTEVHYERIDYELVKDPALIHDLDQIARSSGLLSKLLERIGVTPISLEELASSPKVLSLGDAKILEYRFPMAGPGPRILVLNGKASPLTGPCSFRTLRVFRLNEDTYIQSGSACCDCGHHGDELFQITPDGAVGVHSDYSLST